MPPGPNTGTVIEKPTPSQGTRKAAFFADSAAARAESEGREHPNKRGGEPEPGDGILQVVVRQVDHDLAGTRQAAWRHRGLHFDEEPRHGTGPGVARQRNARMT